MRIITLFLLGTLLSACVDHGHFTVISNKNVIPDNISSAKEKIQINRTGKDISHIYVVIPDKMQVTLGGALNDLFDKTNSDLALNANINFQSWFIPYIYGQGGWTIDADVIKTKGKFNNKTKVKAKKTSNKYEDYEDYE